VQGAELTPRQQRELEEAVRGRFTEWLVASGNLRQVMDLVQLERGGSSSSSSSAHHGVAPDESPPSLSLLSALGRATE
jgi:hypothetical protein